MRVLDWSGLCCAAHHRQDRTGYQTLPGRYIARDLYRLLEGGPITA